MGITNSTYSREDFMKHLEIFETNNRKYNMCVKHVQNNALTFTKSLNVLDGESVEEYDKLLAKYVEMVRVSLRLNELCAPESQTFTIQTKEVIAYNKKLEKIIKDLEKAIEKDTKNFLNR